jgi:benzaldehyde dehydrogenase (NAD)
MRSGSSPGRLAVAVRPALAPLLIVGEIFGPVMPITVVDTEDEALTLLNRHHSMMNSVFTRDHMRGLAFAKRVASNEVHVNDGYARHGGEGQQRAFTRRQWIGVQTTDVPYPAWAESQSPDQ